MFNRLRATLQADPKTIVLPEGYDIRIIEAAARLKSEGDFLTPILIGNPDKVKAIAAEGGFNVDNIQIVDPDNYPEFDTMVERMVELRKGKMTADQCRELLHKSNYFGTMYVKMGYADALLGGATYSTADTVRPALQIIKPKPTNKIVCSCFIQSRIKDGKQEILAMGDCGLVIDPTEDELVEIAYETAMCGKAFGLDPKIAFLSFSTKGSAKHSSIDKMNNALAKFKIAHPEIPADGELQFDAAVVPEVAAKKAPGSPVAGHANTFIFPDINAGNLGYKICQRMGEFEAFGPILLGLNAPINDLSRGCTAEEVYKMALITAVLV